MLSLSFPRGYGLLILCAPTYRPRTRKPPRLALPTIKGDLLADAQKLLASDHPIAAAMTARVEIERLLTVLAMSRKDFGSAWRGIHDSAKWLRLKGVIRKRTLARVLAANDIGNRAAHGHEVRGADVTEMFNAIYSLRSCIGRRSSLAK